jgi:hypothetical protein
MIGAERQVTWRAFIDNPIKNKASRRRRAHNLCILCAFYLSLLAHGACTHKTRVPPSPPAPADEAKYKIQVMSIGMALFTRTHTPPFCVLNVFARTAPT